MDFPLGAFHTIEFHTPTLSPWPAWTSYCLPLPVACCHTHGYITGVDIVEDVQYEKWEGGGGGGVRGGGAP